jgi:methenyltetrahydromethanopterin cyclohydrolase
MIIADEKLDDFNMTTIKANEASFNVVKEVLKCPEKFGVEVTELDGGATILDCGVHSRGGFEVGKLAIDICLGGLGKASVTLAQFGDLTLPAATVITDSPAIATLGIQAGYSLFEQKETTLIGSGPARILAQRPKELFEMLDVHDDSGVGVIVLQTDELPSVKLSKKIAAECKIDSACLFMLITPLRSVAGTTQIAGRAIEDVAFTMQEILHYDVKKVRQMIGTAPIAPVCASGQMKIFPDDFLCYGGTVYMSIESESEDLDRLAEKLVFESTPIYGMTFSELLTRAKGDFTKIPGYPGIFRPARVLINDLNTGKVSVAGKVNLSMIRKCFELNKTRKSAHSHRHEKP